MAIRLRKVEGVLVALCAVEVQPHVDDIYIGDAEDHALRRKFARDYLLEWPDSDMKWSHSEHDRLAETQKVRDAKETLNLWLIAHHPGDFFDMLPDTWIRSFVRGRKSAILCCPQCGQRCSLDMHTIADNGDVSPIVRCETLGMHHEDSDTKSSGCDSEGFHEYITLEEWGDQS